MSEKPERVELTMDGQPLAADDLERIVWAKNKKIASVWGKVDVLTTVDDLMGAVSRLTAAVERQRIVWLEGRHLPQAISLSPKARKVTLVE